MTAFALLAALAIGQKASADSTPLIEGVWADSEYNLMFAGNGRVDYNLTDRYYSAMMTAVPDGSLLGNFSGGRSIAVELTGAQRATDGLTWTYPLHLPPLAAGLAKVASVGETRVTPGTRGASGLPAVAYLDSKASTSSGLRYTMVKLMRFDQFSLTGRYGDKDLSIEIADPAGRTSQFRGTLNYLGVKRVISGRRIMGRAGFLSFVDSRLGANGKGFILWTPSGDRIAKLREHDSVDTDRITIHIDLAGAGTAAGVDKILPRLP